MTFVTRRSIEVIEAFRWVCLRHGCTEHSRVPLVSSHDTSIRFTNSTISVLKPLLTAAVPQRAFLVQPALRLRNLTHWQRTGRMSAFGCYFTAFGALLPPTGLADAHRLVREFLGAGLGIPRDRLLLQVSSRDPDLLRVGRLLKVPLRVDGYDQQRYRHRFGMPGVSGRNANISVAGRHGWADVANIILIEGGGRPLGVEVAFGVNMVLAQTARLDHPVLASIGALAGRYGYRDLIVQDAIGCAAVLAMEATRPVARGRGGNYRSFLRILAAARQGESLLRALTDVACAEHLIRSHASPPLPGGPDMAPEASARQVLTDLGAVTSSIPRAGR